ncbi:hypothetical protein [Nonomuraea sp. CA-141351]|uniref:hypothetical protein n=1 Tax=Nonomuraea sp. CA-141351 TaxID=3239996 RepID=UPI003D8B6DEF
MFEAEAVRARRQAVTGTAAAIGRPGHHRAVEAEVAVEPDGDVVEPVAHPGADGGGRCRPGSPVTKGASWRLAPFVIYRWPGMALGQYLPVMSQRRINSGWGMRDLKEGEFVPQKVRGARERA